MPLINPDTERRIKDASSIYDVVDEFCRLRKVGPNYTCCCPFHEDRHDGNFIVSPTKNIATCFTCDRSWHAVDFLMEYNNMKYGEALRWLAAKYNIFVDDEPTTFNVKPCAPHQPVPELPVIYFPTDMITARARREGNVFIEWLNSLPWTYNELAQLSLVLTIYMVGTGRKDTEGWSIFWQVDDQNRVHSGKLMCYKSDGHRDKTLNPKWVHSQLKAAGRWSDDTHRFEPCLFGLHLVDQFPDAEVCIVESEKSAIIAQALSDPSEKIFMATGGLSFLNRRMLQPLIDRNRYIVLYPDIDGEERWREKADLIDYDRMTFTKRLSQLYDAEKDGPKADIADIIIRMISERAQPKDSDYDLAAKSLQLTEARPDLEQFIDKLNLQYIPTL